MGKPENPQAVPKVPKVTQKWRQEASSQRNESLKGVNSNFLRNLHFAKKPNKRGLKKM